MTFYRRLLLRSQSVNNLLSRRRHIRSFRPELRSLEDRRTPATFTVSTTDDNGDNLMPTSGSLRAAIVGANTNGGMDTITFALPGPSLTITPLAMYPFITSPVLIDGTKQPGIEINGSAIGGTSADGLYFAAGSNNSIVRGLTINRFPRIGIVLSVGGGNLIEGNFLGTDTTGTIALPNGDAGICISSPNNIVGGVTTAARNVISGNKDVGMCMSGGLATGNIVRGNYIGTDVTGLMAIPNTKDGIVIYYGADGNQIGGTDADDGLVDGVVNAGNLISGNKENGVQVIGFGPGMVRNKIQGNIIGLNVTGDAKIPNLMNGVLLASATGNVIGGKTAEAGNVISGNGTNGISLIGTGSLGTKAGATIQGNIIGLDKTGKVALGNTFNGVQIVGLANNQVGGSSAKDEGNRIAGNLLNGVAIGNSKGTTSSTKNNVQGNYIGTNFLDATDLGNKTYGVYIYESSNNLIGGKGAGEGNVIAYNGSGLGLKGHGIEIETGTGNKISRNFIFDNAGRGIDLNKDWVTINDPNGENPADAAKANKLQDYPVLIYRQQGPADFGFHTWKLNSTPNQTFTLEFFSNPGLNPAEYGEGQEFFLSDSVTTDAQGNATIGVSHTGRSFVTVTATDKVGNTSEFSLIDTDADALPDVWELAQGLDIDEDGLLTANEIILTGANRNHKDLFVEVDAMMGHVPAASAFTDLQASFAAAPDANVHNPDGLPGVTLHAPLGETIALQSFTDVDAYWSAFDKIKNGVSGTGTDGKFGTPGQRLDANWPNIRTALRLTHRYGMFADEFRFTDPNTNTVVNNRSGQSELGGNDFMVTVRPEFWGGGITADDRAGVFMHELGHTLGLMHGGGDQTHNKPNYHSVMNYTWQVRNLLKRMGQVADNYGDSWVLDYSRTQLPTLNEAMLIEMNGIQGTAGKFVPYGDGLDMGLGEEVGPVDWNFSNNPMTPVDINFDAKINGPDGMTPLTGHDDWSNLQFYFVESADFADGVHSNEAGDAPPATRPPVKVQSVTINGGDAQRSRVTSVAMNFDQHLTISFSLADAFVVTRQGDGKQPTLVTTVDDSGATTVVTLTFLGTNAVDYGSLADGRYTLTIDASKVSNANGQLDGDYDGMPGGNYVLASAPTPNPPTNIFRLFGDATGDGSVGGSDFNLFRSAFGGTDNLFDFDNDGSVANNDFNQFRVRFGGTI